MVNKYPPSFSDDNLRFNNMCMKGEIPDEVCEQYGRAKGMMEIDTVLALVAKYAPADEPTPSATPDTSAAKVASQRASSTYKKLTRVLRYQLLKEEVLLEHNHACFCCGTVYPDHSTFAAEFPGETYPLPVRCNFPIVKYIEVNNLHHVPDLLKDVKVFDHLNYLPVCDSCKPLTFSKRK